MTEQTTAAPMVAEYTGNEESYNLDGLMVRVSHTSNGHLRWVRLVGSGDSTSSPMRSGWAYREIRFDDGAVCDPVDDVRDEVLLGRLGALGRFLVQLAE